MDSPFDKQMIKLDEYHAIELWLSGSVEKDNVMKKYLHIVVHEREEKNGTIDKKQIAKLELMQQKL